MRTRIVLVLVICLLFSAFAHAEDVQYYEVFSVGDDDLSFDTGAGSEPIRFGVCDMYGNEVIPANYESISVEAGDPPYCVARQNGKSGYMDMNGEWFIEPQYDQAEPFTGDYAVVARQEYDPALDDSFSGDGTVNLYGVIDRENSVVLPLDYKNVRISMDGTIEADGKYFFIEGDTCREIAAISSELEVEDYRPFMSDKLAELGEEPELTERADKENRHPRLDGAIEVFPLYSAAVQAVYPETTRYESSYESSDPVVTCSGAETAAKRLKDGAADMIFVTKEQADALNDGSFECTPFARDAFVFPINAENPIENLSTEQLQDVFAGKITEWSELGAEGLGGIVAYQCANGSNGQTKLVEFLGGRAPMTPPQDWNYDDFFSYMPNKNIEYRNRPDAIGCAYRFYCRDALENGVKLLSVDGAAPTTGNIADGTYLPATDFCIVTRAGEKNANVLALRDWLLSAQGQSLVEKAGFVPIN